jgi:hypothetical protein
VLYSVAAVYDLALRFAYQADKPYKIIECLNRIGIVADSDGGQLDPYSVLSDKIIRIIPKARPIDGKEIEAQRMAKEALDSAA